MEKLCISIDQNTQERSILCKGQGREPALEFETKMLKFGPILPHSGRYEVDLKVTNPCSFPIEFYSLEYDKQYLEDEKVCVNYFSIYYVSDLWQMHSLA